MKIRTKIEIGIIVSLMLVTSIHSVFGDITITDNSITDDTFGKIIDFDSDYIDIANISLSSNISLGNIFLSEPSGSTSGYWNGSSPYISNSNGKTWVYTQENIKSAIIETNATGGGTIWIPDGYIDYDLDNKIYLNGTKSIEIIGCANTEFKSETTPFSGIEDFIYGNNCENITIRNIFFNNSANTGANYDGIYILNSKYINVYDCSFENCYGSCISYFDVENGNIENNVMYRNHAYGVRLKDNCSNIKITKNTILNTTGSANCIHVDDESDHCIVSNNYLEKWSDGGITFGSGSSHGVIEGNILNNTDGSGTCGIYVDNGASGGYVANTEYITITGNEMYMTTLKLSRCDHVTVSNNIVNDSNGQSITITNCNGLIDGNHFNNITGINIGEGCSEVIISNNKFIKTINKAILLSGQTGNGLNNITIDNNIFKDNNKTSPDQGTILITGYAAGVRNVSITNNKFIGQMTGDYRPSASVYCSGAYDGIYIADNMFLEQYSWTVIVGSTGIILGQNIVGDKQLFFEYGHTDEVDDTNTITHHIYGTPDIVLVSTNRSVIAGVTSIDADTFTMSIKEHDGSAASNLTVYWFAKRYNTIK